MPPYDDCESMEMAEMDRLWAWPLRKGRLGRWKTACLSMPNDELRRDFSSKWPDLFSRSVACSAKPESLRDTGVVGSGGKLNDTGDTDGGGLMLVLPDLAVCGR